MSLFFAVAFCPEVDEAAHIRRRGQDDSDVHDRLDYACLAVKDQVHLTANPVLAVQHASVRQRK